jgi:hypothetical protein
MIMTAKQLIIDQGILSTPNPIWGKTLNEITVEVMKYFYNTDEMNRVMSGKQDCIAVKVSGIKIREQKQLLLCNLKQLYCHFKNLHLGV